MGKRVANSGSFRIGDGRKRGNPKPPEERFWKMADRRGPDECWPWLGCKNWSPHGDLLYGHFTVTKDLVVMAHRYAYELLIGPIPHGLTIDHLCRNTLCMNPAHMDPVTQRVNSLRGNNMAAQNARKTHCKRGHPFDEANTYMPPRGGRACRACKQASLHK